MKSINIYDLPIKVEYTYQGPNIGAVYLETGEVERLSAGVTIFSVKSNGIEIIEILCEDQLLEMEEQILHELADQN